MCSKSEKYCRIYPTHVMILNLHINSLKCYHYFQVPETDHDMDSTPLPEEDTNTGTSTQTEISASKLDATEKENIKLNSENVKLKEHLKKCHPIHCGIQWKG